ncbi:hypothetical protein CCMA1212_004654 [Trichoderma ghanense]|uniref:Uncharacterized protein n=1 Tax=Trichoderma ghanense TaxID=65468 RepID=A0ABY2H492_9HYPO
MGASHTCIESTQRGRMELDKPRDESRDAELFVVLYQPLAWTGEPSSTTLVSLRNRKLGWLRLEVSALETINKACSGMGTNTSLRMKSCWVTHADGIGRIGKQPSGWCFATDDLVDPEWLLLDEALHKLACAIEQTSRPSQAS